MSSQTQISVSNISLLAIGSKTQISSFKEGSPQANACATLFSYVFENLARTAWWNTLRKQDTLTLLAAATGTPENPDGTTLPLPSTPWLYSYSYPSDCLKLRTLVASNNPVQGGTSQSTVNNLAPCYVPVSGRMPWAIAYNTDDSGNPITTILTNLSQAQAIYTVNQQNPATWNGSFVSAFVASLAAYLVPALSLNMELMKIQVQIANGLIAEARSADANEGYTTQDHIPDWVSARGVSYYTEGSRFGGYQGGMYGVDSMAWPGGGVT